MRRETISVTKANIYSQTTKEMVAEGSAKLQNKPSLMTLGKRFQKYQGQPTTKSHLTLVYTEILSTIKH